MGIVSHIDGTLVNVGIVSHNRLMKYVIILLAVLTTGCGKENATQVQDITGNFTGTMYNQAATAIIGEGGGQIFGFVYLADGTSGTLIGNVAGERLTNVSFSVLARVAPCGEWTLVDSDLEIVGDTSTGEIRGSMTVNTASCGSINPELLLKWTSPRN